MKTLELNALTSEQAKNAESFNEGPVVHVYEDDGTLIIETENGNDPLKWDEAKKCFKRMTNFGEI